MSVICATNNSYLIFNIISPSLLIYYAEINKNVLAKLIAFVGLLSYMACVEDLRYRTNKQNELSSVSVSVVLQPPPPDLCSTETLLQGVKQQRGMCALHLSAV